MEVGTSAFAAAIHGVKALISAYDGYEKRSLHEIR